MQEGFERGVRQWVFPEKVLHKGKEACLTDVINQEHENVKYLPGIKLPDNVTAEGDLAAAVEGATVLIFVLPHQVGRVSSQRNSGIVVVNHSFLRPMHNAAKQRPVRNQDGCDLPIVFGLESMY